MAASHALLASFAVILLVGAAQIAVAQQPAVAEQPAAAACPLPPDAFQQADFSPARAACSPDAANSPSFCSACICSIGTSLVQGFEAAGVRLGGRSITEIAASGNSSSEALNTVLDLCSAVIGVTLLDSGALQTQSLAALAGCDVNASALQCAEQITAIAEAPAAPAATTTTTSAAPVVASTQTAPAAAPAAAPAGKSSSGGLLAGSGLSALAVLVISILAAAVM